MVVATPTAPARPLPADEYTRAIICKLLLHDYSGDARADSARRAVERVLANLVNSGAKTSAQISGDLRAQEEVFMWNADDKDIREETKGCLDTYTDDRSQSKRQRVVLGQHAGSFPKQVPLKFRTVNSNSKA